LIWFELTRGLPIALRVLREELGGAERRRALLCFARRSAGGNPFAALGRSTTPGETFTRRQLKPVLILHDVLREDLGLPLPRTLAILGRLVAESGAAFIASNLSMPPRAEWEKLPAAEQRGFAQRVLDRFLNARAELVETPGATFGFDVRACHFVDLTRRLGRTELAALFCQADSVFFGRPESPVRLERATTLAAGGESCPFRFKWTDEK